MPARLVVALLGPHPHQRIAADVVEAGSASGLADIAVLDGHGVATSFAAQAQPRTYFVRVRATNAKGVSAPSNELAVVVP